MALFDSIKKAAESFSDETRKKVEQAVTDAGDRVGRVKEGASGSLEQIGSTVSSVSQKVCEKAVDLGDWARKVPDTITGYTSEFEPEKFWNKIKDWAADMGQEVVFMGVAIYYLVAEILGFEHNDEHKEKK